MDTTPDRRPDDVTVRFRTSCFETLKHSYAQRGSLLNNLGISKNARFASSTGESCAAMSQRDHKGSVACLQAGRKTMRTHDGTRWQELLPAMSLDVPKLLNPCTKRALVAKSLLFGCYLTAVC